MRDTYDFIQCASVASEYDGPTALRQLEPPGFMGLNYGSRTPLVTLLGQAVDGAVLGGLAQALNIAG